MTKEQILALAGEPVAYVHRFEKGTDLSWYGESSNHAGRKDWIGCLALFTADQILAVAKPMEDEIAELKQAREFDAARTGVLARLVGSAYPEDKTVQLECIGTNLGLVRVAVKEIIRQRDELKQQLKEANEAAECNFELYQDAGHLLYEESNKTGELIQQLAAAQAKIDSLMLEYCPDEMTPEQVEEWGEHQVSAKGGE